MLRIVIITSHYIKNLVLRKKNVFYMNSRALIEIVEFSKFLEVLSSVACFVSLFACL